MTRRLLFGKIKDNGICRRGRCDFGGIACSTDHYAIIVLKQLGFPSDIKISGFDNISALKELGVSVLSVEYSTDEIAEESINYLLGRRFKSKIEYKVVYNTDLSNSDEKNK